MTYNQPSSKLDMIFKILLKYLPRSTGVSTTVSFSVSEATGEIDFSFIISTESTSSLPKILVC